MHLLWNCPQNECQRTFTAVKSTLIQVMAWCRQVPSHYLSQCWPRSVSSWYDATWPRWVKWWPKSSPSHLISYTNHTILSLISPIRIITSCCCWVFFYQKNCCYFIVFDDIVILAIGGMGLTIEIDKHAANGRVWVSQEPDLLLTGDISSTFSLCSKPGPYRHLPISIWCTFQCHCFRWTIYTL